MRIKRIHGTDMRSALERVRQELGPDAVIISTRTLGTSAEERRGGLTGIEVIAGVDDQPERSAVAQARAVVQQTQRVAEGDGSPVAPAAARAAYALSRAAHGDSAPSRSAGLPLAAVQTPAISRPTFPRVDRNGDDVPDLESLTPALEALAARRDQGLRIVTADDTTAAMTSGTVTPIRLQKTPVPADAPTPATRRAVTEPARAAAGAEDFSRALRAAARTNSTFTLAEESIHLSASRGSAAPASDAPFSRVSRTRTPLPARAEDFDDDDDDRPVSLRGRALAFEPARPVRPLPHQRSSEDDDEMPALAPGLRDAEPSRRPALSVVDTWDDEDAAAASATPARAPRPQPAAWDGNGDAEGYLDAPSPRESARVTLPPRLALAQDDIEARLHAATRASSVRPTPVSDYRLASVPVAGENHLTPPAPRMPSPAVERTHQVQRQQKALQPGDNVVATTTEHSHLPPLRVGEGGRGGEVSPMQAAEAAYDLLCRAGLSETVAESALEAAIAIVPASALTRADVLAEAALSRIIAGLPQGPVLSAERLRGRTVFFAGSAGAGKTSALLKAAVLLRRAGADVGIACADTLRIGSPEQMQRYGDLLRMPVALIHDTGDLTAMLADAPHGRITLVDTPASGLARAAESDELPALVAAAPAALVVIAVPAGTSTADLRRLAARAQVLEAGAVAITKLDEAEAPGAALNVLAGLGLPPLLVSDGRDLLGDVTTPTPAALAAAALDAALPQPAPAPSPEGWVFQGKRVDEYEGQ